MNRLWSELKSDKERAEYLRSGKAHEHGIIAPAMIDSVVEAFEFRDKFDKKNNILQLKNELRTILDRVRIMSTVEFYKYVDDNIDRWQKMLSDKNTGGHNVKN